MAVALAACSMSWSQIPEAHRMPLLPRVPPAKKLRLKSHITDAGTESQAAEREAMVLAGPEPPGQQQLRRPPELRTPRESGWGQSAWPETSAASHPGAFRREGRSGRAAFPEAFFLDSSLPSSSV
ncbi:hypothetical protein P7K49_036878, partial [Saguinus oedipus]